MSESNNLMERAIQLINSGEINNGMALVSKSIIMDPTDPEKIHFRGEIYLNRGNPDLAINDFLLAITLNNNVYQYHYNLGCAYLDLKQYKNALTSFCNAAEINLYDSDIFTNRGLCYSHLGFPLMAIIDFKRALEMNPNDHIALKLIGMVNNVSQEAKDLLNSQLKIKEELHKELDAVFYSAVRKKLLQDNELMDFFAFYTVDFINENIITKKELHFEELNAVLNFTFDFMRMSFKEGYLDVIKIRKVKMLYAELIESSPEIAKNFRKNLVRKIMESN